MLWNVIKIILPATITFLIGILITPTVSDFLYKHKMWKKKAKTMASDGKAVPVFTKFHGDKETRTPRMGGIIIWGSVFITVLILLILSKILPIEIFSKLDFLSRNQTWIPLSTLLIGAVIGLIDDWFEVKGLSDQKAGGLSLKKRLAVVSFVGIFVSSWFFFKLDVSSIGIPFMSEDLYLGWFIIPFFTFVIASIYSSGVIDGLDGLAGGVFSIIFSAYGFIAFSLNQINLAAFCAAIVGGILAFLWFNIPPARFYMSETGSMALTMVLAVVAFMTDSIVGGVGIMIFPIIALPLVATIASSAIQLASKKYRNGKQVFLAAPLHHHFEALGWPAYKITMRYWVFTVIVSFIGIMISLIG